MYEIPLERGKIREFARAAKSKQPDYDCTDAVIPPTFLTTAGNFWAPPGASPIADLGFSLARLLHGEEEYIFHGQPPQAGQTLTVSSRVADRYEKEGKRGGVMRFAVMVTEYRDASDTLVVEQRTTLVETAKAPS